MNKFFYNVSVAIPLRQTFTYHSKQKIIPGTRVAVKFGSRSKLGIVTEEIKITTIQTKAIHQVLDNEPIFFRGRTKNISMGIRLLSSSYRRGARIIFANKP